MSRLLVIRHGKAVDADAFAATGRGDDERPLTEDGVREMRRVARGLHSIVSRIDLLVSSPLVRAKQTAEIVAEEYGISVSEIDPLRPTFSFETFRAWFALARRPDLVAIVGHDPHLSRLITWLAAGVDAPQVTLKKAGVCLLELAGEPRPRGATISWLLTPAQLVTFAGNRQDRVEAHER